MSLKKGPILFIALLLCSILPMRAQINTEQVMRIGANTHYFEDYVLSIQYFNQVISVNPKLAKPYFFRSVAKLNLDDFIGAEEDASMAIERNPFIVDAYEVRGVARQNLGKNREAIDDYNHVLEMFPESQGVLFNKAMAQHEIKDREGAAETFETLLKRFPRYEGGYLGRARLRLETKDTIGAKSDIEKALSINSSAINGYLMRADIAINSGKDYKSALADMDMAIKIQPNYAGYYINRAYLRYMNDDFYGAFADYDHAISLDPMNTMAIFNRGLLRAEVHDTNKAIEDFTTVININGNDYKTLYNRAILLAEIGDLNAALADLNKVIAAYPDFAAAYFLRFDIKRQKGDIREAEKDYNKSLSLAKTKVPVAPERQFSDNSGGDGDTTDSDSPAVTETQEQVKKRFSSLATISENFTPEQDVSGIRGKVQDQDLRVELEPVFMMTYYTSPTEMRLNSEYIREVNEINSTGLLRFGLQVANREAELRGPDTEQSHRSSIDFYNSYIANHPPRAIDFFGRAMDFYTVGDFGRAISDLERAIELTPDFTLAYLLKAQIKYIEKRREKGDDNSRIILSPADIADIMTDIDEVIRLSPFMPVAHYNRGVLLAEAGMLEEAVKSFTQAIKLKPNFGEAYYNRGFVYLTLGDKDKALPDLSRAGEYGIVPSYSLLKRMGGRN